MTPETQQKRELVLQAMQKGFTKLLDEAKVPQREHLAVIKALVERVAAHKKDMQAHQAELSRHEIIDARHEEHMNAHTRQIGEWDSKVQAVVSKDWTGKKGDKGEPGVSAPAVDEERLMGRILATIPLPRDGVDGEDGEDATIDEDKIVSRLIEKIRKEKPLDLSHIKGAQSFLKDGVKYKLEELMHGGGSSTGGDGLKYLVATGTIDNSNTVFTFVSSPTIVIVNGASYINGFGVTIVGTTATLDNAPGVGGSVYGLGT